MTLRRLKRYLWFGIQYFLFEKPRGLDFTMRDLSLLKSSDGLYHGYSKATEKHIKMIFDSLFFTGNEKLLDIGCGKGVVLKAALRYPFAKVAGIEIDERLVSIAKNNFRVLGAEDRVRVMEADAAEFGKYGDYNVFFMFNPFSGPIVEKVADKLLEVSKSTDIIIIYYNPVYMDLFRQKGKIEVMKELYDEMKDYNTCIFRIRAE